MLHERNEESGTFYQPSKISFESPDMQIMNDIG